MKRSGRPADALHRLDMKGALFLFFPGCCLHLCTGRRSDHLSGRVETATSLNFPPTSLELRGEDRPQYGVIVGALSTGNDAAASSEGLELDSEVPGIEAAVHLHPGGGLERGGSIACLQSTLCDIRFTFRLSRWVRMPAHPCRHC
jgi:hypothetical protein